MDAPNNAVTARGRFTGDGGDDMYGIARYLAAAVVAGEITVEDGAIALAEWADDTVLTRVADARHAA